MPGRVPLLGMVLETALADTELTDSMDEKLRKEYAQALLINLPVAQNGPRGGPAARGAVLRTGGRRSLDPLSRTYAKQSARHLQSAISRAW